MPRPFMRIVVLIVGLTGALSTPAFAAQAIGPLRLSSTVAVIGTPTTVIVEASIDDTSVMPNGVNVLRVGVGGLATPLGIMRDNGLNGDFIAGDGVYTLVITLNAPSEARIDLQATAAFDGLARRVRSPVASVFVQRADAPQRALTALADALVAGDLTRALSFMAPHTDASRAFDTSGPQNLNLLVDMLRHATLQGSQGDHRLFLSSMPSAGGGSVPVTFTMRPDLDGRWLVDTW